MIVSGFFPTGAYSVEPPVQIFGRSGGFDLLETLTAEQYVSRGWFESEIHSAIQRERNNFSSGFPYGSFGPTGCVVSGQPVQPPANKYFSSQSPKTNHQPVFEQCRLGKDKSIIVSNHARKSMEIAYVLGYERLETGTSRSSMFGLSNIGIRDTWPKVPGGYMQTRTHYLMRRYEKRAMNVSPFDVGWDDSIAKQISFPKWDDVTYRLITECAASANRKTLDIMTAIGELPEVARMFIDLVKRIHHISMDAHKKEFRIWNAVRKSKLKGRHGFSADDRGVDEANRQLNRQIVEANNAVAEVYLTWRYGIEPLVKTLVDLGDALLEPTKDFFRFREGETVELPMSITLPPGWEVDKETVRVKIRAFIKRRFDLNVTVPGFQHYGGNVMLMLWELTPRSFMIDWLLPIGDMIASLSTTNSTFEEGATISWKLEDTLTFTHKDSNASVVVTMRDYERLVINPNDYCRLIPYNSMNLLKWLDLLAIAWGDFREVAKKTIFDYDPKESYRVKPTNKRRKR